MASVKIKMGKKAIDASDDGLKIHRFEANKVYEVSPRLTGILVDQLKVAKKVKPQQQKLDPPENDNDPESKDETDGKTGDSGGSEGATKSSGNDSK